MAQHAALAEGYRPLCESARQGWKFGRGITKRFDGSVIECDDCRTLITNGGTSTRDLLADIRTDMLRRNPDLIRAEWEVEA